MADNLFDSLLKNSNKLPSAWQSVLKPGTAAYEIAAILNSAGKLPEINFSKISEPGVRGFYDGNKNLITIDLSKAEIESTLPHELTHALKNSLQSNAMDVWKNFYGKGKDPSGIDKQLYDAWRKLNLEQTKLSPMQYPDESYQRYRFSSNEAPAWAVGNMESPKKFSTRVDYLMSLPGGGHYDANLATEQAILRDLYARKLIENENQKKSWWQDIFKDTTASSIK